MQQSVLLIGGGGTLGTYVAKELLSQGHRVEILCPEEKHSDNENLTFIRAFATMDVLTALLDGKMYDGIVNFIHYRDVEEYPPFHKLLIAHTKHLIVLSSYRVYADEQHPVTETAPQLLDTSTDAEFLEKEWYALAKAKLERYLNTECAGQPWTVVRPVISFSKYRFDLVTWSGDLLLEKAKNGETIPLPIGSKNLTAGLDWAGNSGKLIANLLFKPETFGEAYTVSSAQNLTWGQVADLYQKHLGLKFEWIDTDAYIRYKHSDGETLWTYIYDRLFDRDIDNRKILQATGLCADDFTSVEDGLVYELNEKEKEQ